MRLLKPVGLAVVLLLGVGVVAAGQDTTSLLSAFLVNLRNGTLYVDISNADVIFARDGADAVGQRRGTTAQQWSVYNTYTSAASHEKFAVDWQTTANVAMVGTRTAAAGTTRPMYLLAQDTNAANAYSLMRLRAASAPFVNLGYMTAALGSANSNQAGHWINFGIGTSTATSGSIARVTITPTYNQASGTAANTDLLIDRTETAIGSGAQLLLDLQAGSASRFNVSNKGRMALANRDTATVDGATTFAMTSSYMVLACTGAETINTITGGVTGAILWLENSDTDCTIADDDAATAADAVDLTGTGTNDVGAAKKVIGLIYNGTDWLQIFESDN